MEAEFGSSSAPPAAAGDHFIVEDLLDFSNDDAGALDHLPAVNSNSTDSSSSASAAAVDSCNSSFSASHPLNHFPFPSDFGCHSFSDAGDLCAPYEEDLAELEWLSNFVEESFSSENLQKLHLISGMTSAMKTRPDESSETRLYHLNPPHPDNIPSPVFSPDMPLPGKARSKRSRGARGNWASRLLHLSPDPAQPETPKPIKTSPKKKGGPGSGPELTNGEVRRCLHCATDKTPQWRTGPMGPKTLCNACGVRYKSGRLVPEYRPAASPTFVLTKHSNSHRKVMELRRQKELLRQGQLQRHQQEYQHAPVIHDPNNSSGMMFDPTNGDDYLIHQHIGPDIRQLI